MTSVPIALWNLKVPSGGVKVPGYDDEDGSPLPYRITMAAIDSAVKSSKPSTLKCHRRVVTAVDSDDEEEDVDDGESTEEEFVICTLEVGKTYQQTLDITIPEDDEIYFSTSGDLPIYLSGNYITPLNMESESDSEYDEDDEGLYDESPDEDELLLEDEDSEEDELDDLEGRIEDISEEATSLMEDITSTESKGNKRPREETEEEAPELVDTSKKSTTDDVDMSGLSKSQRKKLKKQRRESNESATLNGSSEKKVQFDTTPKGPTPSASEKPVPAKPALTPQVKAESKPASKKEKKTLANGVVIEDAKIGTGPMAKNGSKLAVRYIGKLTNGKEFDKNTKGAPFRFTLGKGEVIKGWDIGMAGMQLGGERKITVPAAAGYGSKKLDGIPPNSELIFEVKVVGLN